MTTPPPEPGPAGAGRGSRPGEPSPRVRLAQLASDIALATPGVVELDAGPTRTATTVGAGFRIPGVTCAAAPDGGYDLSLRLVCELVDLPALAERVRAAILAGAASAGLHAATVGIEIVNVLEDARR